MNLADILHSYASSRENEAPNSTISVCCVLVRQEVFIIQTLRIYIQLYFVIRRQLKKKKATNKQTRTTNY